MKYKMGVMIPSPAVDFDSESASTTPSIKSSPSSPGTCFFSAPTSPTRSPSFRHVNAYPDGIAAASSVSSPSTIPFRSKLKPKIHKPKDESTAIDFDFEFDIVRGQLQRTSLPAADELFSNGVIKPLQPPNGVNVSPESPMNTNKNWREDLHPRINKKCDFEDFAVVAIEQSRKSLENRKFETNRKKLEREWEKTHNYSNWLPPDALNCSLESPNNTKKNQREALYNPRNKKCDFENSAAAIKQSRKSVENRNEQEGFRERGRERTYNCLKSSRKQIRGSLSPFRVGESSRKPSNDSSSKKWKLRDLWLKKSSSNKEEEVKKYSVHERQYAAARRKRGAVVVTAHERRYAAARRAAAEEMRKKTVLPYKHGLLGCMGLTFNPAVYEISGGLGSLTRR